MNKRGHLAGLHVTWSVLKFGSLPGYSRFLHVPPYTHHVLQGHGPIAAIFVYASVLWLEAKSCSIIPT